MGESSVQFYYGHQMPLRVLDEAEFWKLQEAEHTVVIREAFGGLEPVFVDALKQWEQVLTATHQKVVSYIESVIRSPYVYPQLYQQVLQLVHYCLEESMAFIEFVRRIKTESSVVKDNPIAQTILDHIIRESEYFIGIARVILYGNAAG
jgi:hypothetical protein